MAKLPKLNLERVSFRQKRVFPNPIASNLREKDSFADYGARFAIDELNRAGFKTITSCSGLLCDHPYDRRRRYHSPGSPSTYVAIIMPKRVVDHRMGRGLSGLFEVNKEAIKDPDYYLDIAKRAEKIGWSASGRGGKRIELGRTFGIPTLSLQLPITKSAATDRKLFGNPQYVAAAKKVDIHSSRETFDKDLKERDDLEEKLLHDKMKTYTDAEIRDRWRALAREFGKPATIAQEVKSISTKLTPKAKEITKEWGKLDEKKVKIGLSGVDEQSKPRGLIVVKGKNLAGEAWQQREELEGHGSTMDRETASRNDDNIGLYTPTVLTKNYGYERRPSAHVGAIVQHRPDEEEMAEIFGMGAVRAEDNRRWNAAFREEGSLKDLHRPAPYIGYGYTAEAEVGKGSNGKKLYGRGQAWWEAQARLKPQVEYFKGKSDKYVEDDVKYPSFKLPIQKIDLSRMSSYPEKETREHDWEQLGELSSSIRRGDRLPPLHVRKGAKGTDAEGKYVLVDGYHRYLAYKSAGVEDIPVYDEATGERIKDEDLLVDEMNPKMKGEKGSPLYPETLPEKENKPEVKFEPTTRLSKRVQRDELVYQDRNRFSMAGMHPLAPSASFLGPLSYSGESLKNSMDEAERNEYRAKYQKVSPERLESGQSGLAGIERKQELRRQFEKNPDYAYGIVDGDVVPTHEERSEIRNQMMEDGYGKVPQDTVTKEMTGSEKQIDAEVESLFENKKKKD
jgi:hypothetical protein